MSILKTFLLLYVVAMIQSLLPRWSFAAGLSWPLISAALLCIAFRHSRPMLIASILFASFLHDSLMPVQLGASLPYFALLGGAVYLLRGELFSDQAITYILMGGAMGFVRSLYFTLTFNLFNLRPMDTSLWGRHLVGGVLLGALVTPVVYAVIQIGPTRQQRSSL